MVSPWVSEPANPSSWHPLPQVLPSSLVGGTTLTPRAAFPSLLYLAVIQAGAKKEAAFTRKAGRTEEGLPTFQTQGGTPSPQHTWPRASVTTQLSTTVHKSYFALGLLQQADSTVMVDSGRFFFLPPSKKTSTKRPRSTWLLRWRVGW